MNTHNPPRSPVKTATFGFLVLMGLAMLVAVARKLGGIDSADAQRLLGLIVGLVILVIGNLLPKLRPLQGSVRPAEALAAERFAGWSLVLASIGHLAAFLFAPLQTAGTIAAVLGIGAMLGIAGKWILLLVGAVFDDPAGIRPAGVPGRDILTRRRLTIWLLFGFSYVVFSACLAFLVDDPGVRAQLAWWSLLGYWLIYSVILSALGVDRPVR